MIIRKKPYKTYNITLIKGYGTRDYVEVLTGFVEDLMYRCGLDLIWRGSVWEIYTNEERTVMKRSFVDYNGVRHRVEDFSKVGNGDPYSIIDPILIEAHALGVRDEVDKMAKTYMLQGVPIEDSYQAAYEYYTDFDI